MHKYINTHRHKLVYTTMYHGTATQCNTLHHTLQQLVYTTMYHTHRIYEITLFLILFNNIVYIV